MKNSLVICSLFTLFIIGCTSKSSAEDQASDAYEQGLKEGQSKGYEEGQAEGYKKGYDEGYDEGYDKGYDDTQRPVIEEKHGYRESTHPVTCPTCGGDGMIDGISKKEICPTCKMSGVVQVTEKEYY
jgi:hypothetical protein